MYTRSVQAVRRAAAPSLSLVLDAAEAAFAKGGYDGATFSDICRVAGVSRGLPSYLFGSKDELYRQVVLRAAEHLRDSVIEPLRRCAKAASIEQALSLMVDTYVDYLAAHPNVVRLLQWEMLSDSAGARPFAPSSALFAEVLGVLQTVLARGERGDVDARALLESIVALCFFPFTTRGRVGAFGARSVDDRKRHVIGLLMRGF